MGVSTCYDNDRCSLVERKQKERKKKKGETVKVPYIKIQASQSDYDDKRWASMVWHPKSNNSPKTTAKYFTDKLAKVKRRRSIAS